VEAGVAAARAVIFAQMVDDPSAQPNLFPTEEAQDNERQRLFQIIENLVLWENTTNEKVLGQARDEIWRSWRYTCYHQAKRRCALRARARGARTASRQTEAYPAHLDCGCGRPVTGAAEVLKALPRTSTP
jgi:hypothetical protein